jgi:hypothetical protein
MNLTIINEDNAVYVDGAAIVGLNLQTAGIPDNVHALQWKVNLGWIEFKPENFHHPANEVINVLPDWANNCVTAYNAKVAEQQAFIENAVNNQPTTTGTQTL